MRCEAVRLARAPFDPTCSLPRREKRGDVGRKVQLLPGPTRFRSHRGRGQNYRPSELQIINDLIILNQVIKYLQIIKDNTPGRELHQTSVIKHEPLSVLSLYRCHVVSRGDKQSAQINKQSETCAAAARAASRLFPGGSQSRGRSA